MTGLIIALIITAVPVAGCAIERWAPDAGREWFR